MHHSSSTKPHRHDSPFPALATKLMHAGHVDRLVSQQEDAHADVALHLRRGTAGMGGAGEGARQAFLHLRLLTEE